MGWLLTAWRSVKTWARNNGPLIEKILTIGATCFAALASWFSYVATNEASVVAGAAYDFTLRTAEDAAELQRPMLTVLGGKITHGELKESSYGTSRRIYRIELHVKNSGARDAKPVWIGLATDALLRIGEGWNKSAIPKDQEVTLFFDVEGGERELESLTKVTVVAGFLDFAPDYAREERVRGRALQAPRAVFRQSCGVPIVQELTVHPYKTDTGERELILSLGRSIPLTSIQDKGTFAVDFETRNAWDAMVRASGRESTCKWLP